MQYYYLSNKEIDLSNSDIIVNPYDCLDQHMNKGIMLYSYSGVFNSKFLENNNNIWLYKAKPVVSNESEQNKTIILKATCCNSLSNNVFLSNTVQVYEPIELSKNYALCKLRLQTVKFIESEEYSSFTKFPYKIDISIVDYNLAKLMVDRNPYVIFKYPENKYFWNEDILYYAIIESLQWLGFRSIKLFNNIPEKYKTIELCERLCIQDQIVINYVPNCYKNDVFYKKVISKYIIKCKTNNDKPHIENISFDTKLWNIFYDLYQEIYGENYTFGFCVCGSSVSDKNINIAKWMLEKDINSNTYLSKELKSHPDIKEIINNNKKTNQCTIC